MSLRKRTISNAALIGLLAAALALAACGRKGALDLPPASSSDAAQAVGAPGDPGPKKSLPIDVLLN